MRNEDRTKYKCHVYLLPVSFNFQVVTTYQYRTSQNFIEVSSAFEYRTRVEISSTSPFQWNVNFSYPPIHFYFNLFYLYRNGSLNTGYLRIPITRWWYPKYFLCTFHISIIVIGTSEKLKYVLSEIEFWGKLILHGYLYLIGRIFVERKIRETGRDRTWGRLVSPRRMTGTRCHSTLSLPLCRVTFSLLGHAQYAAYAISYNLCSGNVPRITLFRTFSRFREISPFPRGIGNQKTALFQCLTVTSYS